MHRRLLYAAGRLLLLFSFTCCGAEGFDEAFADGTSQTLALGQTGPCWVDHVTVRNFGKVVFVGDMDLTGEIWRIAHGGHLPFRHDGTVFKNREHRLPEQPRAYYHEYVHPTPGIHGPGPQRLVLGAAGEINYTPDHYATFVPLDVACGLVLGIGQNQDKSEWLPRPDSNQ